MYCSFWFLYILRLHFTTAKSNADGFNIEPQSTPDLFPNQYSFWSVHFKLLIPGVSGQVFTAYQFSTQTTFPSQRVKHWDYYKMVLFIPSKPLSFLHLSSLQSLCFKYPSLIYHADIIGLGVTILLEHLFNFLSPPTSFQPLPYFSHLQKKCWFSPHLLT